MKRFLIPLFIVCCLLLCGCGNLFDREYLSVTDYVAPIPESASEEDGISVGNRSELRQVLRSLLDQRAEEGRIVFDAAYEGDVSDDIASVCWQVRTQDALFAYCVENISYDVFKIVTHYEARFAIRYTEAGLDQSAIVHLQLTTGLEDRLQEAIQNGDTRLVVLIARSSYNAEDVESLAERVYRENPAAEPKEPRVTVNMLSGTGMQRLYEINFNYGMNAEELELRRQAIQELDPFAELELSSEEPAKRALAACEYLKEHCAYHASFPSDIYSALISGEANSEGLALGYVELCRQLDVPCQIVYGQRDWKNCCWNIIRLGKDYYHVDVAACIEEGLENGFLLQDETMWSRYRWDISSYPPCSGELNYWDLVPLPEEEPEDDSSEEAPQAVIEP